jgi:hypothetical protein
LLAKDDDAIQSNDQTRVETAWREVIHDEDGISEAKWEEEARL